MIFRRLLLFFAFIVLSLVDVFSQTVVPSISNVLRYGNGARITIGSEQSFRYLENVTDIRVGLPFSLTAGGRILFDSPPEIGQRFEGLKRRYLEYHSPGFRARIGSFSELFGRGLALHLFENRGLAFDSWMDGANIQYATGPVAVKGIIGSLDFRDSLVIARTERYNLRGLHADIAVLPFVTVGGGFVWGTGDIPNPSGSSKLDVQIPEIFMNLFLDQFSASLAWSGKQSRLPGQSSYGTGFYATGSFFGDGLGITVEYKNYAYDIRTPAERFDYTRPTRALPFQNPPTVLKEHVYTLLTRSLHEVDFNDELGIQTELFWSPNASTTMNLNASISSRHGSADSPGALPSLDQPVSPFWELFLETEHYYSDADVVRFGLARRAKVFYADFTGPQFSHNMRSTVIPIQIQHMVAPSWSLTVQSEHEWVFDNYNPSQHYYNHFLTIIGSHAPNISMTVRHEITTNRYDGSGKQNWLTVEGGYRWRSHVVTVSYGRERGGQVCSNGICRTLLPFSGIRFSVQSTFLGNPL